MLRKLAEKVGIQGCPIQAILTLKNKIIESLRGKVSADVLAILDNLLPKFAPKDPEGYEVELHHHLQKYYIKCGGDPAVLESFLNAFGKDINKLKYAHESLLGRGNAQRRTENPDLWSSDNILQGLKSMPPTVHPYMVDVYGAELCDKRPLRLAKNISLLFHVLNSWLVGSQNTMLNRVFHPSIDALESMSDSFVPKQTEDQYELMQEFHSWCVQKARSTIQSNIPKMNPKPVQSAMYERVNFFIGSTQLNRYDYRPGEVLAGSVVAGLDSAISMYTLILFKISQVTPGNSDGTMSLSQKKMWTKTTQNFMVPNAKKSHAWAAHFFDAVDARGVNNMTIRPTTFTALHAEGGQDDSHISITPEAQMFLGLHMVQLGMRQNGCPALKSIGGKAPALFRLAEVARKWYDESKIQLHISGSKIAE